MGVPACFGTPSAWVKARSAASVSVMESGPRNARSAMRFFRRGEAIDPPDFRDMPRTDDFPLRPRPPGDFPPNVGEMPPPDVSGVRTTDPVPANSGTLG